VDLIETLFKRADAGELLTKIYRIIKTCSSSDSDDVVKFQCLSANLFMNDSIKKFFFRNGESPALKCLRIVDNL
jgi:hypothetical protein